MLAELTGVTKAYDAAGNTPTSVLRGIDLAIDAGETLAIEGRSGSGKSTLLNILGTLDRATSGRYVLDGRDVTTLDDDAIAAVRAETIGFVFQLHHLLPQLDVLENVLLPTLATTVPGDAEARARALLERVGLADRIHHRPGQLSGGECQRAAVVRALINEPKLVLADEPTGSLDRENAESLAALLTELNRENGTALVVVTHAPDLARRIGRTIELRDGVLVAR